MKGVKGGAAGAVRASKRDTLKEMCVGRCLPIPRPASIRGSQIISHVPQRAGFENPGWQGGMSRQEGGDPVRTC